ncbi:MAG TPA: DUF2167 domain-containing protein [Saprospiraceae bacterium]|nr:DUF2167 domain-containing protein [Saprospiraceae bacterium]
MQKLKLLILINVCILSTLLSQNQDSIELRIKEIEQSLVYMRGAFVLDSGNVVLTVPPSFKFLNKTQSIFVLTKIFGNPIDSSLLGMLVPKDKGILDKDGWVFTISYESLGYVNDKDADNINFDELLLKLKNEVKETNNQRKSDGFNSIELIGWASKPYYDKNKKVLHWAKELKFGRDKLNTLNYNLRILGRNGVLVLNAVANINKLNEVESLLDEVITSFQFLKANKYSDFNQATDKIAKYNILGLVSGKVIQEKKILGLQIKYWIIILLVFLILTFITWKLKSYKGLHTHPSK